MNSSSVKPRNTDFLQLIGSGLLGGLIGAGLTLLLTTGGRTRPASQASEPSADLTGEFARLHADLERLIELQQLDRDVVSPTPTTGQRKAVTSGDVDPGLVPALASLEVAVRELLERPARLAGGGNGENTSLEAVGSRPPDPMEQALFAEALETDPNSLADRYFGAPMSRVYALLGRPSYIGVSEAGVYWHYENVGGDVYKSFSIRFHDGIVIALDS